jgi:hypothetical protein
MKKYFVLLFGLIFIFLTSQQSVFACGSCNAPNYSGNTGSDPSGVCLEKCTTPYGSPYCANGGAVVSNTSGNVYLFGDNGLGRYTLRVNGNGVQSGSLQSSGVNTGIKVKAGDTIGVALYDEPALGWRLLYSSKYDATVNALGYTIISRQWIADSCSGQYDSWDFNDGYVVIAVKKSDCENSDLNLSATPPRPILGYNETVVLTRTGTSTFSTEYTQNSNTLSLDGALNCPWASLQSSSSVRAITCSVIKKPAYPNTLVNWTHTWCNSNTGNCSSKKICTKTYSLNIDPFGPYMYTELGNTFVKSNLNIKRFPVSPLSNQKFSTYNYLTTGTGFNTPIGSNWLSLKNYLLFNYNDANGNPNFFDYLKNRLSLSIQTTSKPTSTLSNVNYEEFVGDNDVVFVNGHLTLENASCNSKTIFFVSGNLIVNTNFDINGNNACLFIVKGDTNVKPNITNIKAFIITNGFSSQFSANQLILKGGLIVQNINAFERNVNIEVTLASLVQRTMPSEILTYEGARYIKLLGNILSEPTTVNIREIQYTGDSN